MSLRRSAAPALFSAIMAACASVPSNRAPDSPSAITLIVAASPERVRDQLVAAFPASGLPVTTSQPGVVEFHGPRERGILGYYEVFARAVIEPVDCTTRVTLFGEETRYPNAGAVQGTSVRVGPSSSGRAGDVWQKLQLVARALGDSSRTRAHC